MPDWPRLVGLDVVRGLAIVAVVLFHGLPASVPGGFLGVDVFFVLSGFLVTGALIRAHDEATGAPVRQFWLRRSRRILPAVLVMLVTCTAVAQLIGDGLNSRIRSEVVAALTFSTNWNQVRRGHSYFDATQPPLFEHLWSLAIEEQFYLIWPLVLFVMLRSLSPKARVATTASLVGASALCSAFLFSPTRDPSRLYFGTDTHGYSLMVGALAALLCAGSMSGSASQQPSRLIRVGLATAGLGYLGLLTAVALLVSGTDAVVYRGGTVLVDVATAGMVIMVVRTGNSVLPVIDRPLAWLGIRSYGLYLWHWPVMVLLLKIWPAVTVAETIGRAAAMAVASTAMAMVSWRFVEEPVVEQGWRGAFRALLATTNTVGRSRMALPALSLVLITGIATTAIFQVPVESTAERQVAAGERVLRMAQAQAREDVPERPARLAALSAGPGRRPSGREVSMLGDSVTVASAQALLDRLPGIDIRATVGAQLWDAPATVTKLRKQGRLRPYIVIALGTNGDVGASVLDQLVDAAGPGHLFVFVTAHAPRPWIASVDAKIRTFVVQRPTYALADWDRTAGSLNDLSDGIHPGPRGAARFAELVDHALANTGPVQSSVPVP